MSITRMGCEGSDVYLTFTDDPAEDVEWPTRCVCCWWCSLGGGAFTLIDFLLHVA